MEKLRRFVTHKVLVVTDMTYMRRVHLLVEELGALEGGVPLGEGGVPLLDEEVLLGFSADGVDWPVPPLSGAQFVYTCHGSEWKATQIDVSMDAPSHACLSYGTFSGASTAAFLILATIVSSHSMMMNPG
ncbi:hypothetical protein PsorP6_015205 [Peronosclerospora sorghi]|uniref:Uncharacterized protein n=1 Tax=Peronosclerospora sorghi TaxID=230839 RepID=A0ACC0VRU1_9STRA|nr:hypothetical protein PsorP6_015205 [Peronosclerospora sorghi]